MAYKPYATRYQPEGTTQPDFQMFLTLLNPAPETVTANIAYSVEGSTTPVIKSRSLPPGSRTTIDVVSTQEGALGDQVTGVATVVSASQPIVVERPLYFVHDFGGGVGLVNGATDKAGATSGTLAPGFLTFSEGNGLPDFEQFFTILNTSDADGTITI